MTQPIPALTFNTQQSFPPQQQTRINNTIFNNISIIAPRPRTSSPQSTDETAKTDQVQQQQLKRLAQPQAEPLFLKKKSSLPFDSIQRLIARQYYTEALPLLETFLANSPFDAGAMKTKFLILLKLERIKETIEWGKAYDRIHPNDYEMHFLCGAIYLQCHQYPEALRKIKAGFDLAPSPQALEDILLLNSKVSFDHVKETALFHLNRAISLSTDTPQHMELIMLRGLFFMTQFKHNDALRDLSHAASNRKNRLASKLRNLALSRVNRFSGAPDPSAPYLQSGRVPIAALLNYPTESQ